MNTKIKMLLIISSIVFVSLFVLALIDYNNYSSIIVEDNKNVTRLVSSNIYSEINGELLKPIYVSLTMANNRLIKDLAEDDEASEELIVGYLNTIKENFGYDSVFYVSNITNNYYHYDGLLKKISKSDPHDVWFYDFIQKGLEYDIDIDTDQASEDQLTFFVNCSVKNNQGDLLGVVGVGVKMDSIRKILFDYSQRLGIEIFLVDTDGIVQVHDNENYIENHNIFDDESIKNISESIVSEKGEQILFELNEGTNQVYLTSRYIEELDWYLIVNRDTTILRETIKNQIISKSIIFLIVVLGMIVINNQVVNYFHREINRLASRDTLTNLNNRRIFDQYLEKALKDAKRNSDIFTLVLFDTDRLKYINDNYGHAVGDQVIKATSEYIRSFIRKNDILARWGGDEFSLLLRCNLEDSKKIIQRKEKFEKENTILKKCNVKISYGMAEYKSGDDIKSIFKRADRALYDSKKGSKNKLG